MTLRRTCFMPIAVALAAILAACATNPRHSPPSPQAFAREVQGLLDQNDLHAIDRLMAASSYPLARRSMLIDLANECLADDARCRVEAAKPAPDAFEPSPGAQYVVPGGVTDALVVKAGGGRDDLTLPIARVEGGYRIFAGELTAEASAMQKIVQHPRERIEAHLAEVIAATLQGAPAEDASGTAPSAAEVLDRAERIAIDEGALAAYRRYIEARRRGDAAWLAEHGTLGQRRRAERLALMPPQPWVAIERELDASFAFSTEVHVLYGLRYADSVGFAVHGMTGTAWPAGGVVVLHKTGRGWELATEAVEFWPAQG